jgi:predicted TIM-barrel fold metal-dependent hydrolase
MTPVVVDSHIHLWDLEADAGQYGWLLGEADPLLGPLAELPTPLWDSQRFATEVRHSNPSMVVHVQASDPPGDPVDETAWLVAEQDSTGWPDAIVARVDLRAPDASATMERHLARTALVRGVRDMTTMGCLGDPAIQRGLTALQANGLSWELACTWEEMPAASRLAHANPDLLIVLGHAGFPISRDSEYLKSWRQAVLELASAPNVVCKVSGLGMGDHEWTAESWRPLVEDCLSAFGPNRCMFGSNWPVDRLYASYDAVVGAFDHLTGGLSPSERDEFFRATALRVYGLESKDADVTDH